MQDWLATLTYLDVIGIFGVALYLGSYAALQMGLIRGQSILYALLNASAAGCVLISLIDNFNISSAIIQISWIVISGVGILRLLLRRRSLTFSAEERGLIAAKLPKLPPELARRFLDCGQWVTSDADSTLISQGEPVPYLIYFASGEASILMGDKEIARCSGNAFLGELTCLSGMPATATVVTHCSSRIFVIEAQSLRRLFDSSDQIRWALSQAFAEDTKSKLVLSNMEVLKAKSIAMA